MKTLYLTSVETFSGKTAVCLGIGKHLQTTGRNVGYLKSFSQQPVQALGHVVDEDAEFIKTMLGLPQAPWELCPVVVTPQQLIDSLSGGHNYDSQLVDTFRKSAEGKDIMLVEAGGSLRDGYCIGFQAPRVAEMLDARVLVVVRFRRQMRMVDDALGAKLFLGGHFLGVVLNWIPDTETEFVTRYAIPYLEQHDVAVLGALPERPRLAAISVGELADTLKAEILAGASQRDALAETLTVGAMGGPEALARFRRYQNKAVITGGDRSDIQLAALETSTVALILTGNLRPAEAILQLSEQHGVAVLLVPTNTLETVEAIERVYGKTRLGQAEKLASFQTLMREHMDIERLLKLLTI